MARLQDFPASEIVAVRPKPARGLVDQAVDAGPLIKTILSAYRSRPSASDALSQCLALIAGEGPAAVVEALRKLSPAWKDHAIASVYAVLMPGERRKRLGAYFTPPHLVDHLLGRLQDLGLDLATHRLRDPAAGGAAFLVPLARHKVSVWRASGVADDVIVSDLAAQLRGCEIDADLASLANALLRRMLVEEFGIAEALVASLTIVATGDSLAAPVGAATEIDHEIGNPPYLRLPRTIETARQDEFLDISNGRLNLYAMFLRRALDHVPARGLIGYVVPASFLGGPEFKTFRATVASLAEVLVIDLIEKRSDVFLDATQDACFVVLRRRQRPLATSAESKASSGLLKSDGAFKALGDAIIGTGGAPWRLPGKELDQSATLGDWGYRGSIGYLVANRQPERLHTEAGSGRYPLVWAKAISPEGKFDFDRALEHKESGWVDAPEAAPYIVRTGCVAIQRTSSRGQKRRITAAPIPAAFVEEHGGIIAENHVILLVPTTPLAASVDALAAALNSTHASEQLDRVCGSASISVRLLETLQLSPPPSDSEQ